MRFFILFLLNAISALASPVSIPTTATQSGSSLGRPQEPPIAASGSPPTPSDLGLPSIAEKAQLIAAASPSSVPSNIPNSPHATIDAVSKANPNTAADDTAPAQTDCSQSIGNNEDGRVTMDSCSPPSGFSPTLKAAVALTSLFALLILIHVFQAVMYKNVHVVLGHYHSDSVGDAGIRLPSFKIERPAEPDAVCSDSNTRSNAPLLIATDYLR